MAGDIPDQPKTIIVRFQSYNAKSNLYASCKHLGGMDPGEYFAGTEKI